MSGTFLQSQIHPNSRSTHSNTVQFSSVQSQLCPTLCDPMNHSMPGLPVHHQLPEFTQTHLHQVSDAIHPSHPLLSPSPPGPQSLPASESFPMSQLFAWGGQSIGVSASASVLPKNTQDWSPLECMTLGIYKTCRIYPYEMPRIHRNVPHSVLCSTLAHSVNECRVKRRVQQSNQFRKSLAKIVRFLQSK